MNWPGVITEIAPPHMHIHFELLLSAGKLLISTVGEPGNHGAGITGRHGIGVSTPSAAAVAEATVGFAREVHTPNGGILAIGAKSIIVAASGPEAIVGGPLGMTLKTLGAAPKGHFNMAPATTCTPIMFSTYDFFALDRAL